MAVTAAQVRAIIATSLTDPEIEALIAQAVLISADCAAANNWSTELTDAINMWLTAHMIASTSESALKTSYRLGDASEGYQRASAGKGLEGTSYGQQVMLLDPTGCLARRGKLPIIFKVL